MRESTIIAALPITRIGISHTTHEILSVSTHDSSTRVPRAQDARARRAEGVIIRRDDGIASHAIIGGFLSRRGDDGFSLIISWFIVDETWHLASLLYRAAMKNA